MNTRAIDSKHKIHTKRRLVIFYKAKYSHMTILKEKEKLIGMNVQKKIYLHFKNRDYALSSSEYEHDDISKSSKLLASS